MSNRKRIPKDNKKQETRLVDAEEVRKGQERRRSIKGLVLLLAGLLCLLSYAGVIKGSFGSLTDEFLRYGFGMGAIVVPLVILILGFGFLVRRRNWLATKGFWLAAAAYLCLLGLFQHFFVPADDLFTPHLLPEGGGLAGALLLSALRKVFGVTGGVIVVILGLLACLFAEAYHLGLFRREADGDDGELEDVSRRRTPRPERTRRRVSRQGDREEDAKPAGSLFGRFHEEDREREHSALDVYHDEEFSEFNADIRKKGPFERILDFGRNVGRQNEPESGESFEDNPFLNGEERRDGVHNNIITNEEADESYGTETRGHGKPHEGSEPRAPLSPIYPEEQQKVVLRPSAGSWTGAAPAAPAGEGEDGFLTFPEAEQGPAEPEMPASPEPAPAADSAPETAVPETPAGSTATVAAAAVSAATAATAAAAGSVTDGKEDGQPEEAGRSRYIFPPLSLLNDAVKTDPRNYQSEIAEKVRILEQTLADFKVNAKVINATRGPAVTRFELKPAPGVKVSSVVNLADDIALRLAAPGVRVEAPSPGKAAIGIEAPNAKNDPVNFKEVVDNDAVRKDPSKLCVGLGRDISGNIITIDLAKMPHLLIAGSTGSGKSVCVNTLIAGILYKARPDEVKLILVDPKVVELTNYNGIPHLLTPVVTDAKKAASALHWAVAEMERRYQSFADNHVRDINAYNEQAKEKMPFIVIVIDEMSDLMMVARADVEDAILRLAQKARACGIHLVLATQRPSVDVITGIVKANIPSRIAFAVASLTDSRTILDMGGAEKLLGKGDMLFSPIGTNKPLRVQGAFVSDAELNRVTDFIKNQAIPVEYSDEVTSVELPSDSHNEGKGPDGGEAGAENQQDELLEDAIRLVLDLGQASASMLQRRFHVGYSRAGRLVDTMESMGIVGPAVGSKPRELKMSRQEVEERYLKGGDGHDNGK